MLILSQDAAVEEERQVCHKHTSGQTKSKNKTKNFNIKPDHFELHVGYSFTNYKSNLKVSTQVSLLTTCESQVEFPQSLLLNSKSSTGFLKP